MCTKVKCPRCECFMLHDGDITGPPVTVPFVMPETLPEPTDQCELRLKTGEPCECHTGVGLMPRFVIESHPGVSATQYAMENYRHIDKL